MSCIVCGKNEDTRAGACFKCAGFESLIAGKVDMNDNPVKQQIKGSESFNILHQIIKAYEKN